MSNLIDIDQTFGNAFIQWNDDIPPILEWNEGLFFHWELSEKYDDGMFPFDFLNVDEDFLEAIQKYLKELLPDKYNVGVAVSDQEDYAEVDDEVFIVPCLKFEVWIPEQDDAGWEGKDDEEIFELFWPAVATLFNVTDPGTFNSPYLFGKGLWK